MTFHARAFATPVLKLAEVDSTNAEGLRRAAAGERGPLWITAERQTAGRGRSGRSWTQDSGNLAASFLFAPDCQPSSLHQLSLLTGVAAFDAVCAASPGGRRAGLRLKWPNDVLIDAAKVGGILVETTTWAGASVAVIGIGLNTATAPAIAGRSVGHLDGDGQGAAAQAALSQLDRALSQWLGVWDAGRGFDLVRSAWLERAGPPGEPISVNLGAARIEGHFHGIDAHGALLLREHNGMVRHLTYGDVTLAATPAHPPKGQSNE